MTFDERVRVVAKKGFTERQARFLTTVMLQFVLFRMISLVENIAVVG